MDIPRVSPVGLRETPASFEERPRRYPAAVRLLALSLLAAFLAVATATTAGSLGAYCLTTDTANTSALPRASS